MWCLLMLVDVLYVCVCVCVSSLWVYCSNDGVFFKALFTQVACINRALCTQHFVPKSSLFHHEAKHNVLCVLFVLLFECAYRTCVFAREKGGERETEGGGEWRELNAYVCSKYSDHVNDMYFIYL